MFKSVLSWYHSTWFAICVFIIVITALRIVKRLRSSPLPEARSQHRRQENKLTWLTFKICGVFLVCWLPLFVCFPLAQFGRNSGDILLIALIITLAMLNFNYVVNPFLYHKILKQRPVNIPKVTVVVARDSEWWTLKIILPTYQQWCFKLWHS